ncbi:hypothetical protein [Micromonospora sp. NPDC048839]|uniref:Gp37-like protein n=1 Tax=Micromonospora sp. NPDC048839 TaxID=3155641 RepID=UPI0033FF47BF
MKLADITVEARDRDLKRLGLIRPEELDLDLSDLHNGIGNWKLTLAAEHPLAGALRQPGSGIIVTGPTDVLLSGPVVKPENQATSTDPYGTVTVEGVDDTVLLADALAYPQPANPDPTKQTLANDTRTGNVESLMHAFVNANIGPGAPSERRAAGLMASKLTMGANLGRGPVTTKSARFPVLGNLLSELAATANLGFRIVQRGNVLVFETYAVADRSREIRLDIRNNTLAGHRVAISPPASTRAIVAGQNEGVDRQFLQVTTADSLAGESDWGRRIERFVDQRNTNVVDELRQAGLERLADDAAAILAVQAVPMEDSGMDFGVHWGVGDKVGVVVEGQELSTVVTGYVLKVNREGFRLGALIGDPSGFDRTASMEKRVQGAEVRLSSLERTAESRTAIPTRQPTDPLSAYPSGISLMGMEGSAGPVWGSVPPTQFGTIATFNNGGYRSFQVMQVENYLHFRRYREDQAGGWGNWQKVLTEARLSAADFPQGRGFTSYPWGTSFLYLNSTESTTGGWYFGAQFGMVTTYRSSDDFAVQTWTRHQGGSGGETELWQRTANQASGWSRWRCIAGSVLRTTSSGRDTNARSYTGTTFGSVSGAEVGVVFVAPPSAQVEVIWDCEMAAVGDGALTSFTLREGAVMGQGSVIVAGASNNASRVGAGGGWYHAAQSDIVPGLTPGASYNVRLVHMAPTGTMQMANRRIRVRPDL